MSEVEVVRSYVRGRWHVSESGYRPLVNPANEEVLANVSSDGIDFASAVKFARDRGRSGLQQMSFAQRAGLVKQMSTILREHRAELLELSRLNNGTTRGDGAFDVDGASGTLAYYAAIGKKLGDTEFLCEGEPIQLSREGGFVGRHILVPRPGVAVHINAFNFPAWGFAEKAACALLAGMPVITKPASATSLVAARCVELIIEAEFLPEGALQMICGSVGDLLDGLGPQDVVAFTGSAETAAAVRSVLAGRGTLTRLNVEADSLNAAILAPDVATESRTMDLFVRDVVREMTQKAGQKCTAVRRILVPETMADAVTDQLCSRLETFVVGDPADENVTMGPLATQGQLQAAEEGVAALTASADLVLGTAKRIDGRGAPEGKGYFFGPTLLRQRESAEAGAVHRREVFAPVAALIAYDGSVEGAAGLNALGGGTLVTSVYTDDLSWLQTFAAAGAASTGRLYVGSEGAADEAPGSGVALPQSLHGGPGRAGGGEELGGLIGVGLYLQRLAVQGSPTAIAGFDPTA